MLRLSHILDDYVDLFRCLVAKLTHAWEFMWLHLLCYFLWDSNVSLIVMNGYCLKELEIDYDIELA